MENLGTTASERKKGQRNVWQGNKTQSHVFHSVANHSSANDFAGRTSANAGRLE
jgi:hypothetical protein